MEHIIKRIIDIENKAQQITSQAKEACEDLPAQIKEELSGYREETEARYAREFEKRLEEETEKQTAVLSELERSFSADCERLRAAYERHGEQWAHKLYESVTGNV